MARVSTSLSDSRGGCPRRSGLWSAKWVWYASSMSTYNVTRKVSRSMRMAGLLAWCRHSNRARHLTACSDRLLAPQNNLHHAFSRQGCRDEQAAVTVYGFELTWVFARKAGQFGVVDNREHHV